MGTSALLGTVGLSVEQYCKLTPEGRAAIRDRLGISAQMIRCPNDGIRSYY